MIYVTALCFYLLFLKGHFLIGLGDYKFGLPLDKTGNMADTRASPNDPFFYVFHAMLDCIFEEWLRTHPGTSYPSVPKNIHTLGNRDDSYFVPLFPLQTNVKMYKESRYFGYSCNLPNITVDSHDYSGSCPKVQFTIFTWLSALLICTTSCMNIMNL